MLDTLYKDSLLPADQGIEGCQITLGINAGNISKTQKVKKTMTEEEANEVREKNEVIRKEREAQATKIADRYSCFKRDFMGAPIWKAMKAVVDKTAPPKPS